MEYHFELGELITRPLMKEIKELEKDSKKWKIIKTFFETDDLNKIYSYKLIVQKVREFISQEDNHENRTPFWINKKLKEILKEKK